MDIGNFNSLLYIGRVKNKHTRCWSLLLQFTLPQRKRYAYMSVSEFRSRLQFTFPYRNVFQSVLSQFPLSYYNLRPLLGVLYRFAQYEIFLILQFAFQQQSVLKSKTMMNNEAITIHVPTQKRYNRCYFEVCFNSRSHVVSVIIDVYYQINVLELQFTLPRRERPSNQLLKSREEVLQFTLLRRACHNPKMCNTICIDYNSLFYKEESKPSIRDVGPCYCNSRSHIGSAVLLIVVDAHSLHFNSRSRIGSAVNIQTNTTTQPKILYNLSSLRT